MFRPRDLDLGTKLGSISFPVESLVECLGFWMAAATSHPNPTKKPQSLIMDPQARTPSSSWASGSQSQKWQLPQIRGSNVDSEKQGSHCKDTHNKDPQFIETAKSHSISPDVRCLKGETGCLSDGSQGKH